MNARVLVAGLGNVFFGDDGFGVEVVRRLQREPLPDHAKVADFGIRRVHLAFELLTPLDLLVLVDAAQRGGTPGTLYLIDPDDAREAGFSFSRPDAHGMDIDAVFTMVRSFGARLPPVRVVGCEPANLGERMEISPSVRAAISPAIELIRGLIQREVSKHERQ